MQRFRPALRVLNINRNVSSVAIKDIESRWVKLPEGEQGAVADYIYGKEKGDWKNMTLDEKRASYGPHGARTPRSPDHSTRVFGWTAFIFGLSFGIWQYWLSTIKSKPHETEEWKEARRQKDLQYNINPHQGVVYEERIKSQKK